MKKRITITVDENLLKIFRKTCNEHGYKISTKIGVLIRDFLKNKNDDYD